MANYVISLATYCKKRKKAKTPNEIFYAKLVFITPDIAFLALKTTWLLCAIHTSDTFNVQPAKKTVDML